MPRASHVVCDSDGLSACLSDRRHMGKGSSAARRAQKARNQAKKNNEQGERKNNASESADDPGPSHQLNEVSKTDASLMSEEPLPPIPPSKTDSETLAKENDGENTTNSSTLNNPTIPPDSSPDSPADTPKSPTSTTHSGHDSVKAAENTAEIESLREQVRALEGEIQELQQTLAESHQAFAEQIVQMSATRDHEKDAELQQLQQDWERSKSDLRAETERVHALEKQVAERDTALEAKSTMEAEHAAAMSEMQAKILVREAALFQDLASKVRAPMTESLAKVATDLGYTKESDYVRCFLLT